MAIRASLAMALSSTRSLSRMSISASVGAVLGELIAQDAALVFVAAAGSRSRPVDVGKPESEIDHLEGV